MKSDVMRVTFSKDVPGLGKRIKSYRLQVTQSKSKSLTQLAADAGISVPHWNRIEKEQVQDLPLETLQRIEKALDVDLEVEV